MTILEQSIVIDATPGEIEAVSMVPANVPKWYAGIESIEPDGKYPELGGSAKVVYKSGGAAFNLTITMTEREKNRAFTQAMEGMISGSTRTVYEPQGNSTKVTMTFDYEMPGGGVGKLLDRLVVERMNKKNLETTLKQLKALVEKA